MAKQMEAHFSSPDEALKVKEYLLGTGIDKVTVDGSTLTVDTSDEDWISSYEILQSFGGTTNDEGFEEYYQIHLENEDTKDTEIELIDRDSYIDANLGYGDYELVEPYVLETYEEMLDEENNGDV
ncbi:hypothetical protein [Ammoniphilus resinae]|uniref:General stress protein 17M-like domain-containing protein n=1 Tax=Ammoniphilus resinae TaxID=861532 RepID=A0ABS4GTF2_9BACL|nr:hypothetical protein [Ammoniphilus resinae]MBP1933539.1 hypothetical protein [Ammoniphilus resinae]